MKRNFLICLIVWFAGVASSPATALDEANQQFTSGEFLAAVASYEKLIADQGPDATVYYNLGNAYQSQKLYGPAILAYERARLITPRDPDLLANLALARKAAAAFEDSGMNPRLEAVLGHFSRNEWSWLVAGGALVLGGVALLRGVVKFQVRWLRQLSVTVAVFAGIGMVAGSAALYLRRGDASRGIVLSENATVRLSPFEKAESLGTAGPGRVVHLREKSGDFHYVEVPGTSLHGWLAGADVAAITPEESVSPAP